MIYNKPGEEFLHKGVCYKVGRRIIANEASDYAGLFGNILEIRTEDDRETDNDTSDIYCAFDPPVLSADRLALEQTFSQLYHEQKHIEDLGLDMVIMGPEMIVPLEHPAQVYPAGTLYIVVVHWATDGEYGSYEAIFTERTDALHPVSYTHLDVYKRQPNLSALLWTARPASGNRAAPAPPAR